MPVSFEKIKVGGLYERPYLANIWGYNGFQAISRGGYYAFREQLHNFICDKRKAKHIDPVQ